MDPARPETVQRVQQTVELVAGYQPDLVVATGDLSANGHIGDGRFEELIALFDACPAAVHSIPGNHDVGEPGGTTPVTDDLIARFRQSFGDDRFCVQRGNWTLIGINSLCIGSGLDAEREQDDWLDEKLDNAEADGRMVAVFLHQPPYLRQPDEVFGDHSDYWSVKLPERTELVRRLSRPHVKLWANGHVHWYRLIADACRKWVWAPSVSMIVDDAKFPAGGQEMGIVVYRFRDDRVDVELARLDAPVSTYLYRRPMVALPDNETVSVAHVVLDCDAMLTDNGTLNADTAERLARLAQTVRICLLTTDTSGRAQAAVADLPVTISTVQTGHDKARCVEQLKVPGSTNNAGETIPSGSVIAVGSSWDDLSMFETAAVGIALTGRGGADPELVRAAHLVVDDIDAVLDILLDPPRLEAILQD